MKAIHLGVASLVVGWGVTCDALEDQPGRGGGSTPVTEEPTTAVAPENTRYRGRITAVDDNAKSFSVNDEVLGTQRVHIDEATKLTKSGGGTAKWDDLQIGVSVEGSFRKMAGQLHAESVAITGGPEGKGR